MPHDEHSPEPDVAPLPVPNPPVLDDMNLDGVPLPVYPLPSKPFAVQPPTKIPTGFAPVIPLEKSGRPVRRWRQANREIRGIAGGRWFAKSWIGDKESEYAAGIQAASASTQQAAEAPSISAPPLGGLVLPKLPALSISAGGSGRATPRLKALKAEPGLTTASSSRAGSTAPEIVSAGLISRKRSNLQPASGVETPVSVSTPIP